MKHLASILFLIFLTSFCFKVQAQQQHFIYIQSEDRQPFAVVLNGKVYSSSDYGYVIVPKLADGEYNLTVSFPMNKYPDQSFKCVINKKDAGFKLKNTDGKVWALENMQTQKLLAANTASANNDFSNMLSDVVNDSNLANTTLPVNNKPDTTAAATNVDTSTVAAVANDIANLSAATQTNNTTNSITDSVAQLQKISETKQDTGTNMVFVDRSAGADTIKVFVPDDSVSTNNISSNTTDSVLNQQPATTEASNIPAEQPANIQNTDTATTAVTQSPQPTTDTTGTALAESSQQITDTAAHTVGNPFYKSTEQNSNTNTSTPANTDTTAVAANATVTGENLSKPKVTNAVREDCNNMFSDKDMDKLKRKMFVQNNDNDMVQTALKYVSNKCLTTDQVKTLGNIFLSDDGRYNLYDALYRHVYDYGNYSTLESQIVDSYYKRRFEAMLK